jgi:two-component system nitrate/nitrite response regulator NarL
MSSREHRADTRIWDELTQREHQVTRLATGGLANKDIACRLNITEGTVKVHLHNIYQKAGVKSRTALTALAHDRFSR